MRRGFGEQVQNGEPVDSGASARIRGSAPLGLPGGQPVGDLPRQEGVRVRQRTDSFEDIEEIPDRMQDDRNNFANRGPPMRGDFIPGDRPPPEFHDALDHPIEDDGNLLDDPMHFDDRDRGPPPGDRGPPPEFDDRGPPPMRGPRNMDDVMEDVRDEGRMLYEETQSLIREREMRLNDVREQARNDYQGQARDIALRQEEQMKS